MVAILMNNVQMQLVKYLITKRGHQLVWPEGSNIEACWPHSELNFLIKYSHMNRILAQLEALELNSLLILMLWCLKFIELRSMWFGSESRAIRTYICWNVMGVLQVPGIKGCNFLWWFIPKKYQKKFIPPLWDLALSSHACIYLNSI